MYFDCYLQESSDYENQHFIFLQKGGYTAIYFYYINQFKKKYHVFR